MFLLKSQDDGFGSANLGIFKPRQMRLLLSIKTVVPRRGGKVWYDDQRDAHRQIYQGEETVDYAFMGTDPEAADNRWLREAYEHQVPVIYFLGVSPGKYQAMFPTFISGWNPAALKASISFGLPDRIDFAAPPQAAERRYALQVVKQRLHQDSFRDAVIAAYGGRCALSGLREHRLLDAAHIVSDKDELLGQPVAPNGLPLSKIRSVCRRGNQGELVPDRLAEAVAAGTQGGRTGGRTNPRSTSQLCIIRLSSSRLNPLKPLFTNVFPVPSVPS